MGAPESLKVAASGIATLLVMMIVHLETMFLSSSTFAVLRSGLLMCPTIFAHNFLSALLVAVAMYFCASYTLYMLGRSGAHVRRSYILSHAGWFSAVFAVVSVLEDVVRSSGLEFLSADIFPFWASVAAIEACGIYFAMLMGLRRQINAWNLLRVCAIFMVGAVLETAEILCLLR
jgi:hypothetical protein